MVVVPMQSAPTVHSVTAAHPISGHGYSWPEERTTNEGRRTLSSTSAVPMYDLFSTASPYSQYRQLYFCLAKGNKAASRRIGVRLGRLLCRLARL